MSTDSEVTPTPLAAPPLPHSSSSFSSSSSVTSETGTGKASLSSSLISGSSSTPTAFTATGSDSGLGQGSEYIFGSRSAHVDSSARRQSQPTLHSRTRSKHDPVDPIAEANERARHHSLGGAHIKGHTVGPSRKSLSGFFYDIASSASASGSSLPLIPSSGGHHSSVDTTRRGSSKSTVPNLLGQFVQGFKSVFFNSTAGSGNGSGNATTGRKMRDKDDPPMPTSSTTGGGVGSVPASRRNSQATAFVGKNGALSPATRKAGLLIVLVLGLITFTRWLLPGSDSTLNMEKTLTPRDYLNASLADPAPFDFCPVFGPGDPVTERRGQWGLLKSRLHQGSNARIQNVIHKALSGAPVTISVLGGSVSACHGAGDDPVSMKCYPYKFFDWWNSVFPHPASELTNGAARRTDSAYFAYCSAHHLPDHTDLVILEFDSADPNDPEWLTHFELLVRSILVRPEMPAVIILGHFSPQIQAQNGFAGPELLHTVVAQFYDIPHISTKGVLYHDYLVNPEAARTAFYADPVLANAQGHDLIADVLISYMMQQICSGWAATMGHAFDVPYMGVSASDPANPGSPQLLGGVGLRKGMPGQDPGDGDSISSNDLKYTSLKVPLARLSDRPSDILEFREIEPFCVSANDLINPLPPSLFYGSGWNAYHPAKGAGADDRHYWYADIPTSRLRVPLMIGAGDVGIYYLQAPEERPLGNAMCWVDDNVAGAVELSGVADVSDVVPTLTIIDRHVSHGPHFIECQLMGEEGKPSHPFKILGIFTT